MGQFTARPEEPTEWAGLPSEPVEPRSQIESLAAPVGSAESLDFLGSAIESVVIPLVPVEEDASASGPGSTRLGGGA